MLTAGQTLQPESRGQAINTPVVTLLVTPEQAETLTLAGNEGRIQLVLRNGADQATPVTTGRDIEELYGFRKSKPEVGPTATPRTKAIRAPVPAPITPAKPDEIVVFRGNQRTVEVVGANKPPEGKN